MKNRKTIKRNMVLGWTLCMMVNICSPRLVLAENEINAAENDELNITDFQDVEEDVLIEDEQISESFCLNTEEIVEMSGEQDIEAYIYKTDSYCAREYADINSNEVMTLDMGELVYIKDAKLDEAGTLWYLVQPCASFEGGIQADMPWGYVERYYLASEDERLLTWEEDNLPEDTVEELAGASKELTDLYKFPDEYRDKLYSLKKAHPTWQFVAYKPGIKFDKIVSMEAGKTSGGEYYSLIEKSADPKYVSDISVGSGWYAASYEGVEHYMYPPTYFSKEHIFAFESMAYNASYQTEDATSKLLSGTFMSGKIEDDDQTYAHAFYKIGSSSDVAASPLFLAARVKQEQGSKGTSGLISGKYKDYEGYYNYFNIQATGTGDTAIKNGLKYAKSQGWNTRYKALKGGAEYVASKYIKRGQNSLYLQKFNVAYEPYCTHQYMQNIRAPYNEANTMYTAYKNAGILDRAFVFRIPVYSDMTITKDDGSGKYDVDEPQDNPEEPEDKNRDYKTNGLIKVIFNNGRADFSPKDVYYTGADIKPLVRVYDDGKLLVEGRDYSVTFKNNRAITIGSSKEPTITVKGKGNYSGNLVATYEIKDNGAKSSNDGMKMKKGTITGLSALDYIPDGKDRAYIQSGYSVRDEEGTALTEGRDYLVNYIDNYKAGTASIVVLGIGDYSGTLVKSFKIRPHDISNDENITVTCATGSKELSMQYEKDGAKLPVTVKLGGMELVEGIDYTVSYSGNKGVGAAGLSIKGKGNYSGTIHKTFAISTKDFKKTTMLISSVKYNEKKGQYKPSLIVVDTNGKSLKEGQDYKISGVTERNGVITVMAEGMGNYSSTEISAEYKQGGLSISKSKTLEGMVRYDGQKKTAKDDAFGVILNGTVLKNGVDYKPVEQTYINNINKGTASVYIQGIGDYSGYRRISYKINSRLLN